MKVFGISFKKEVVEKKTNVEVVRKEDGFPPNKTKKSNKSPRRELIRTAIRGLEKGETLSFDLETVTEEYSTRHSVAIHCVARNYGKKVKTKKVGSRLYVTAL